jgi:membrane protease YdiL (CAAX protease family)
MHIPPLPWDCALILIALPVIPPWRGTARVRQLLVRPYLTRRDRYRMYGSTMAVQWLAVGLTAWRAHARGWTWESLGVGWGAPGLTIAITIAMSVALAATQRVGLGRMASAPEARGSIAYQMLRKLMPQEGSEIAPFAALGVTVGICEEFLYRGFAFAAFLRLLHGSVGQAIFGSAVLFAAGHLYQGAPGLISTFILGVIFGGARFWTGSLVPGIVAHTITDLIAGILGPRLLKRGEKSENGSV